MFLWKCVGALLGYQFTASLFGALAGWLITSIIIRLTLGPSSSQAGAGVFSGGAWRAGRTYKNTTESRQLVFLETVFQLMGRLSKADGRISESEVAHTESFMSQLGMSTERRREAIALFKQGADPHFDVDRAVHRFTSAVGSSPHLRQLLLVYILDVALADGAFNGAEEQLLRRIALMLGFTDAAFEQLVYMKRGQDHFGSRDRSRDQSRSRGTAESGLSAAYQALGVSSSDDDKTIKRAYRKLISEFHPDKLIGQGVPEDMIKAATERSQEIQRAYDVIREARRAR